MKYRWKKRPYKHQVAAVKKLLKNGWGGALLMSPRTGKTKVAIDYASILHQADKVNRVLVICPLGVMAVWEDEIAANCPANWRVFTMDRKARKRGEWPTELGNVNFKTLDWVVLNLDAFSAPGRKTKSKRRSKSRGGRYDVKKAILKWKPQLIIIDESHRIKSPSAKKSRMIHTIGPVADYRVIMTGTAVTKKKRIFDIYSQWKFLNPERFEEFTFKEFKNEVGIWTDRNGFPQWLRNKPKKIEWVRKEIHQDSFAITRDECFDLPPRQDQVVHVDLDQSAPVYDQMAEEMVAKLRSGEISTASLKIVQSIRLAQITSGVAKTEPSDTHPDGRLVRVGREKLDTLESLLEDLFEAEEKVVIGARFKADISSITRLCRTRLKVPAYQLYGAIPREQRQENIRQFQKRDGPSAFIIQPQAGSLGIELGSASTLIWFSLTNSYVDFTQTCDRIALSRRSTTFMYLLARDTIDEVMYENLQEDGDVAKAITDSPERLLRNFKG